MCECSSCQVINAATNYIRTETLTPAAKTTNVCKRQADFCVNRKQQPEQQRWVQNEYEWYEQNHSIRSQFHHRYSCYNNNSQETRNVEMLQHEQRPISDMHELTFPTNYKQTINDLMKAQINNNNSTTKTPMMRSPILDSSNSHHQQLHQQAANATNCMNDTMSSVASNPISTTSPQGVGGGFYGSHTPPSTIGVNLRVTGQCSQGGRKYMEDYFSVAYQQSENAKDLEYAFIGIYDGHGGAEAATFAKEHLMMQIINQKAFWSDSDHDVLRAIREGYIATHYAMWRDQENWPKTANGLLSTAGTTATIAFIRREKIYIGHVGDSGIVLGYQNEGEKFWRAKQLTVDHKPESAEERARIQRSGGKVVVKSGVPRVVWNRPRNAGHRGPIRSNTPVDEVPFLAVARSLGDLWSYNSMRNVFVVSPDPDVQVIKINSKTFRCLIFGTDGLWNVVTPQEAIDTVYERECINERLQAFAHAEGGSLEWTNPSKGLVERALKTWSAKKMRADNTSVVTVILYPPCNETANANYIGPNGLPYNSLPNGSCGLEYTEVCAEVAATDCGTTYEQIAEKHTMPEAFRDFDYFLDEAAINAALHSRNEENSETKYCNEELSYWHNWNWDERQSECAGDYNHHSTFLGAHSDVSICSKEISSDVGNVNNAHSLIACDGDENAVDGVHNSPVGDETANTPAVLKYATYNADTSSNSNASSDVSNVLGNAGFMTFAESYNSFLNEQMSHDSTSSSNSNSNCQIISGTSEILQEQQLYQQQCMSEEEGYSLTKLETRREQQRCSGGVQTFKIFQTHDTSGTSYVPQRREPNETQSKHVQGQVQRQHTATQSTSTSQLTLEEARELEEALTWEPECATLSKTMNRFLGYTAEPPKPLELNSLLQQEREEERQVAIERLEMQRQLAGATLPVLATEAAREHSAHDADLLPVDQNGPIEDPEDILVEEYIEEENESIEDQQPQDTKAALKDTRVQINEVSSSVVEKPQSDSSDGLLPAPSDMSSTTEQAPKVIEKIEKIEILPQFIDHAKLTRLEHHPLMRHKSPPLSQYKKSKGSSATTCSASSSVTTTNNVSKQAKSTPFDISSRPLKAYPGRTSLKRSQTQFPNIPNENARLSEATSSHEVSKRRRYNEYMLGAVSSTSNNSDNSIDKVGRSSNNNCRNRRFNSTSTMGHLSSGSCAGIALEKRQLRSNSGTMDYSKRTLRTRNSLTKDLKAKASLTTTMRRVTSQFLHETAVSLMHGNSALTQQRQQHSANTSHNGSGMNLNRNSSATNSSCSSSRLGRRSRAEKLLTNNTDNLEAAFSHVINLRSRKVAHFAVAAAAVAAAAAAGNNTQSTRRARGVIGGVAGAGSPLLSSSSATVLRRERHNLRSLNSRNAASASLMSANGQRDYGYGKSTRGGLHAAGMCAAYNMQSNSVPTSKLLNGAAGVTHATTRPRAHTLLLAKQPVRGTTTSSAMSMRNSNAATPLAVQPTSYGKRTTALRSSGGGGVGGGSNMGATPVMMTRSGRTGRRMNR